MHANAGTESVGRVDDDCQSSTSSPRAPVSRWHGPLAGVATAGLALGVAELVAGAANQLSPVVSVGNRVIDNVPVAVKDFAIDTFGTNDKPALIIGTLVGLALFAAVIGGLAQRRAHWGWLGVGAFGLLGAWAALKDVSATTLSVAPSLAGALVAAVALQLTLHGVPSRPARKPHDAKPLASPHREPQYGGSRRVFLLGLGATTGLAAMSGGVGRALRSRFDVAAARAKLRLPAAAQAAIAIPESTQLSVAGITPFFTSNADFYRIDTALTVPQVDPDTWRLKITGMVERELEFSLEELLSRPLVERVLTLVCVSNEVGGTLVGTATWLGVPLRELLEEAGVQTGADQLVSRSVDGYTAGTPTQAVLDGRDALLVFAMNGEPLPTEHGFPARLIVPGLYGYVSATKWVTELQLTRFDDFDAYWVPRGYARMAPVKTLSRVDTPRGLQRIPAGKTPVAGVAWATHRDISKVEVRVDDGPWQAATLAVAGNLDTWRQWVFEWEATPGRHAITSRAFDGQGQPQTEERTAPLPDGATGWHQVVVLVD